MSPFAFCVDAEYQWLQTGLKPSRLRIGINGYSVATKPNQYSMRFGARIYGEDSDLSITGSLAMQLVNWEEVARDEALLALSNDEIFERKTEVLAFDGSLRLTPSDNREMALNISEYSPSILRHTENPIFPLWNVNPMEHDNFQHIINDNEARLRAVRILKEFEPDITDLRYVRNEMGQAVPIIETANKNIPLSVYGDGMKRALVMLNAVVSVRSGVMLSDEFETAIHPSATGKVFFLYLEFSPKRGRSTVFYHTQHRSGGQVTRMRGGNTGADPRHKAEK
jgi:hypothetical protein